LEYEKQRNEKLEKVSSEESEKLKKAKSEGSGSEIKFKPAIDEVSAGREMSDIYLRHPGNESSEDEDGTEDKFVGIGDDEMEEQNFQNFVSKHKAKENVKIEKIQK
jgi:hypothetical protein